MSNKNNETIHLLDLILLIFFRKPPSRRTERNRETTKILDVATEKGKEIPNKTKRKFRILGIIVLLIYF
tara:strand:- start:8458 stop:8664 length:207 start_codon:yes stop_codon:yes gene_type:complete